MRNVSLIALMLVAFAANAGTAWKDGQMKDEDGDTICVYTYRLDKVYRPAEFGDYCPLTVDVPDEQ